MVTRVLAILLLTFGGGIASTPARQALPVVELKEAPAVNLPGGDDGGRILSIDCNSPAEWDNNGNLFLFTSSQHPYRSSGPGLFQLEWPALPVTIVPRADVRGGRWLEATYRHEDGTLYGWYHNEPPGLCGSSRLTAPRVGAMVSYNDGLNWQDLGIILEAPAGSLYCDTKNYFFAGGNGDFSVIADQNKEYFYFFISTYHRQFFEQGVAVARMRFEDRDDPIGRVWKWNDGGWSAPGLGGQVTPIFPALADWHGTNANAFWGAAIHFNTYLDSYVMLLNHAVDRYWAQEGIYVTFNDRLDNPAGWGAPQRLPLAPPLGWYPQVIGLNYGETDKVAGQFARLFIAGLSSWEIVFYRTDGEEDDRSAPVPPRPEPKERLGPVVRDSVP